MTVRSAFVLAVLLLNATAFAETYDYTVDRFEADGNVNGPLDGTPDVVDEFDDDVLAPWFVRRPSASESGGFLHVQSPGVRISLPGIFPVGFDASAAGRGQVLQVGNGDGVLRVVLPQQAIGANDAVSFDLGSFEDNAFYYAGIVLTNFNSQLAKSFNPPYPVGLAVTAHAERLGFANEVLAREHHPLPLDAITGPIILELRYEDATHEITPAISLDGGTTFDAAFAPLELESETGGATAQVAVAALDGKCPATQTVEQVRIKRLNKPAGQQRMKVQIDHPSDLLRSRETFRLVLTDQGAGGATLYDITVPDNLTAFQHPCGPRDGWVNDGYVNYSDALPPDCVPGSAHGLRRVRGRWTGHLRLRLDVRDTTLGSPTGPIRASIYNGTGPVNECDGYVGEAPCTVGVSNVRCQP